MVLREVHIEAKEHGVDKDDIDKGTFRPLMFFNFLLVINLFRCRMNRLVSRGRRRRRECSCKHVFRDKWSGRILPRCPNHSNPDESLPQACLLCLLPPFLLPLPTPPLPEQAIEEKQVMAKHQRHHTAFLCFAFPWLPVSASAAQCTWGPH